MPKQRRGCQLDKTPSVQMRLTSAQGSSVDRPGIDWQRTDERPPTRVFHKSNIYIFIYQYELPSHNISLPLHENRTGLRLANITKYYTPTNAPIVYYILV